MNVIDWSMQDRIYLAIVDLMTTDNIVRRIYKVRTQESSLFAYCESVEKNPNQTQVAQRIYAHAVAERLENR